MIENLNDALYELYLSGTCRLVKIKSVIDDTPDELVGNIDDVVSQYLFENSILITVGNYSWSVSLPLMYHRVISSAWWRFSYSVEKMRNLSGVESTKYGLIFDGVDTKDFLQWVNHYSKPQGNGYKSYKQAVMITRHYENIKMLETSIIPIISDPLRWNIRMITPLGFLAVGELKGNTIQSLTRNEEDIYFIIDGMKRVSPAQREKVLSPDTSLMADGNDIGVTIERHTANGGTMSLRKSIDDLLLAGVPESGIFSFEESRALESKQSKDFVFPVKVFRNMPKMYPLIKEVKRVIR